VDSFGAASGIEVVGLSVQLQRGLKVGSLRYFDAAEITAANIQNLIGGPLPAPLKAVRYATAASHDLILAWRSPSETWLLTPDAAGFEAIVLGMSTYETAGCLIDQTGGLWPWQVSGARTRDLLLRLGSVASIPALGEARVSRVADLPVMALCVHEGQIILVVERVYSEHLLRWIGETAADF
jgi:sarcosine oxidase gamma subunit